jgi:hypothetical protein
MNKSNTLFSIFNAALISLLLSATSVIAQDAGGDTETLGRSVGVELDATVASVDAQTREISLSSGIFKFTAYAPENIIDLSEISVGDRVTGTYSASVEAELRAPTDAELAAPWEVLEEGAVGGEGADISVEKVRMVRAVVTISGLDQAKGILVVEDSRGLMHFITGVEPEKMAGLAAAQQVVVVFTESMVVTLEKKS